MMEGGVGPMALRLSGQLLLGVTKIYSRKTGYLLDDCTETIHRLKMAFKPGSDVDLPSSKAQVSSITVPTNLGGPIEEDVDLEQFLNENFNNVNVNLGKNQLAAKPNFDSEMEMPRLNFGVGQEEEIPAMDDIEVGRRATLQSTELGRSSIIGDAAFSPLRAGKSPLANPFDEAIDAMIEDMPMAQDDPFQDVQEPVLRSERSEISLDVPAQIKTTTRRRRNVFDIETEIPNSEIQALVRDPSELLMEESTPSTTTALDKSANLLNQPALSSSLFTDLFAFPQNHKNVAAVEPQNENIVEEGFGGWDADPMAMDDKVPVVNEFNECVNGNVLSSPMKRLASEVDALNVNEDSQVPILSKNGTEALENWSRILKLNSWTSFEDLLKSSFGEKIIFTKREVATSFFELLSMSTKSLLSVKQAEPFSQIQVKPSNLFFN